MLCGSQPESRLCTCEVSIHTPLPQVSVSSGGGQRLMSHVYHRGTRGPSVSFLKSHQGWHLLTRERQYRFISALFWSTGSTSPRCSMTGHRHKNIKGNPENGLTEAKAVAFLLPPTVGFVPCMVSRTISGGSCHEGLAVLALETLVLANVLCDCLLPKFILKLLHIINRTVR